MKKHLLSCEFNMDTACVELKFTDGTLIAIAAENEIADKQSHQRGCFFYAKEEPHEQRSV